MADLYNKIGQGIYETPKYFSNEASHLIAWMLTVDPKKRATIADIKNHPWTNLGYDHSPVNHVPIRPTCVLDPHPESISMLVSFGFNECDIRRALARADLGLHPLTSLFFLIDEARIRENERELESDTNTSGVEALYDPATIACDDQSDPLTYHHHTVGGETAAKLWMSQNHAEQAQARSAILDHEAYASSGVDLATLTSPINRSYAAVPHPHLVDYTAMPHPDAPSVHPHHQHSQSYSARPDITSSNAAARHISMKLLSKFAAASRVHPINHSVSVHHTHRNHRADPGTACTRYSMHENSTFRITDTNPLSTEACEPRPLAYGAAGHQYDSGKSLESSDAMTKPVHESIIAEAKDSAPTIRTIRGFFNTSTTVSIAFSELETKVELTLAGLHELQWSRATPFIYIAERSTCPVNTDFSLSSGANRLEIEICRVDRLDSVYCLQFKRVRGTVWAHKKLCSKIIERFNELV